MSKPRKALGHHNIIGEKITRIRLSQGYTQKALAAQLQKAGMDISEISMSRIEGQYRVVADFELKIICEVLGVSANELLEIKHLPSTK